MCAAHTRLHEKSVKLLRTTVGRQKGSSESGTSMCVCVCVCVCVKGARESNFVRVTFKVALGEKAEEGNTTITAHWGEREGGQHNNRRTGNSVPRLDHGAWVCKQQALVAVVGFVKRIVPCRAHVRCSTADAWAQHTNGKYVRRNQQSVVRNVKGTRETR